MIQRGLAVVDNDCHMTRLREVGKGTDAGRRSRKNTSYCGTGIAHTR